MARGAGRAEPRSGTGSGRGERPGWRSEGRREREKEGETKEKKKGKMEKEKEKEGREREKERFAAIPSAVTTTPVEHVRLSRPRAAAGRDVRVRANRVLDLGVGVRSFGDREIGRISSELND